jgi:Domain of unknown function (DUF4136)
MKVRGSYRVALVLIIGACAPLPQVRTVVSPAGGVASLRTFSLLPAPRQVTGGGGSNDPMRPNSGSNRALRDALLQGFVGRGYAVADSGPDFAVAYYATARDKLDIMRWDYGYPWWPRWWLGWGARGPIGPKEAAEYGPGTVVVDVVDPTTRELLWRGKGRAPLSDDEQASELGLKSTIAAIVARFPRARR